MFERLDRQKKNYLNKLERVRRKVSDGKMAGEEDRIWLDTQTQGIGHGLDIACGDFVIANTDGVDTDLDVIGPTYLFMSGDELSVYDDSTLDFITTNYLDGFPNIFKVLREWHRALKPGGLLALICKDSDDYDGDLGVFCNRNRVNAFTAKTIKNYLYRTKFENVLIEKWQTSLRVRGYKPNE